MICANVFFFDKELFIPCNLVIEPRWQVFSEDRDAWTQQATSKTVVNYFYNSRKLNDVFRYQDHI